MGPAEVTKVEVYKDHAGEWRYRGRAANGEETDASTEGHEHKQYVLGVVHARFPDAEVTVTE